MTAPTTDNAVSPEVVHRMVEESTRASGVPYHVEDLAVLSKVAVLLGGRRPTAKAEAA